MVSSAVSNRWSLGYCWWVDVVLRGPCDTVSVLHGLRVPATGLEWASQIDLRFVTWCEPAVLVGLACVVEAEIRRGQSVRVRGPENRSVSNYLARARLGHVLSELGAEHDLPYVSEAESASLLELRIFNGSRGAHQLAGRVYGELHSVSTEVASAMVEGICETGSNVEQHSGQRYGFVAAQTYRAARRSPRRFMFAVGDSGKGLLGTLAKRGAASDAAAVALALQPGSTETDDPARGVGLSDILSYLKTLGGGLDVVSGGAHRRDHAGRQSVHSSTEHLEGTLVQGLVCF